MLGKDTLVEWGWVLKKTNRYVDKELELSGPTMLNNQEKLSKSHKDPYNNESITVSPTVRRVLYHPPVCQLDKNSPFWHNDFLPSKTFHGMFGSQYRPSDSQGRLVKRDRDTRQNSLSLGFF